MSLELPGMGNLAIPTLHSAKSGQSSKTPQIAGRRDGYALSLANWCR